MNEDRDQRLLRTCASHGGVSADEHVEDRTLLGQDRRGDAGDVARSDAARRLRRCVDRCPSRVPLHDAGGHRACDGSDDEQYDRYSGQPLMSNVPVRVDAMPEEEVALMA